MGKSRFMPPIPGDQLIGKDVRVKVILDRISQELLVVNSLMESLEKEHLVDITIGPSWQPSGARGYTITKITRTAGPFSKVSSSAFLP